MNKVAYTLNQNGSVHGFLVESVFSGLDELNSALELNSNKNPELNYSTSKVVILNTWSEVADFCDDGTTIVVSVEALINNEPCNVEFYVQTVNGLYSTSRGCWVTTPSSGEDMDFNNNEEIIFECCDVTELAQEFFD